MRNTDITSTRQGYLPTLDGWRAVAVSLVLLAHGSYSLSAFTKGVSDVILNEFPKIGLLGVRIFFGISGFLICSRLLDEKAATGRISIRRFYVRRFFRIIPPLLMMMLIVLIPAASGLFDVPVRQWVASLFFAANYVRDGGNWYLGHLWSLAVEEHFYMVFPGLLVLAGVRRGMLISAAVACGIILWRGVVFKITTGSGTFDASYFWGRTDIQADGLLWGCVAAFLYDSPRWRAVLRTFLRPVVWWLLVVGLLAADSQQFTATDWKIRMATYSVQSVIIPLILVGTVLRPEGTAGRLLELRLFRWLGRLSYSVYLWQQIFLVPPENKASSQAWLQQFPTNLAAILSLALASYYLVERPAVRLSHRIAGTTRAAVMITPALSSLSSIALPGPGDAPDRGCKAVPGG